MKVIEKKNSLKKASNEREKAIKFVGQTQSKLHQIHNPKQLSGGKTFLWHKGEWRDFQLNETWWTLNTSMEAKEEKKPKKSRIETGGIW